MKPRFNVKIESSYHVDEDYGDYMTLDNVIPESISLECPHCSVFSAMAFDSIVKRSGWKYDLICLCPQCKESVFVTAEYIEEMKAGEIAHLDGEPPIYVDYQPSSTRIISIYPRSKHYEVSEEIPENYRRDFLEAYAIRNLSPKGSAALCRRILQTMLREEFKIEKRDLAAEIGEFINLKDIPSYLSQSVDAIRNIGNLAAHPIKNVTTGEIVDVEPGEVEWLLETLDALFDFTFVQPKRLEEMKSRLNAKLQAMEKPLMK